MTLTKNQAIALFFLLFSAVVVDVFQTWALGHMREKQKQFQDKIVYWQYQMQAACHYERGQISIEPELL